MRSKLNPDKILGELHSEYDPHDPERVDKQILTAEQYLDRWTERTTGINPKMPVAYLKNVMESTCIDSIDDRAILFVLLKRGCQLGKRYGDFCTNLKFSAEAKKDSHGMKASGAFKIFHQKYENLCLDEQWRALLDSKSENSERAKNLDPLGI